MTRAAIYVLMLAIAGPAAAAQPLGRLFFTPTQRAQLDTARAQKRAPQAASAQPAETRPQTQSVTYNGIVRRSDGKAILWLNSRPANEKEALSDLALTGRVRPDGGVTLQVPGSRSSVDLKVGQRAELQTGTVSESRPEPAAKPEPSKAGTPKSEAAKPQAAAEGGSAASAQPSEKKAEASPPPAAPKDGPSKLELERQRAATVRSEAK